MPLTKPVAELLEGRRLLSVSLVSVNAAGTGPGNGESIFMSMSADGRYVAFASQATDLVSGIADTPGTFDVFVRDRQAETTRLVSVNAAGTAAGNAPSSAAWITPDGRYVAFESTATDLLAGVTDANGGTDVFIRDLATGTTALASRNAAGTGTSSAPSVFAGISPDGRRVVFQSTARDLIAGFVDGNDQTSNDVFVHDRVAGVTSLVTVNFAGTASGNGGSFAETASPALSADGRYVIFQSAATDLIPGFVNVNGDGADGYRRDLDTGTTTLVTVEDGTTATTGFFAPAVPIRISPDGRYVVSTWGPEERGASSGVMVRDISAGTTMLTDSVVDLSDDTALQLLATGSNLTPPFDDSNTEVVDGQEVPGTDLFLYDVEPSDYELVTMNAAGTGTGNRAALPFADLGPGDRFVGFISPASDLVAGVIDAGVNNVYVRDVRSRTTSLITRDRSGAGGGDADSGDTGTVGRPGVTFSGNGRVIAFNSLASNLSAETDANQSRDVFVADVPGAEAGIDIVPPTATLSENPATGPVGRASYTFVVTYADDVAIDPDVANGPTDGVTIRPPEPGASPIHIMNQIERVVTGNTIAIRYGFQPLADGSFGPEDNGTYTIELARGTARDAAGNRVGGGVLGTFVVDVPTPPPGNQPDLAASFELAPALPAAAVAGRRGRVRVRVTNSGTAPYAGRPRVSLYASIDVTVDTSDVRVGTIQPLLRLRPGASRTLPIRFTYPQPPHDQGRPMYLIARADDDNALIEADEANNYATSDASVDVAPRAVDLAVAPPTLAGPRLVGVTVSNLGNRAYHGPVTFDLFASPDDQFDLNTTGDVPLATTTLDLNLRPHASKRLRLRFNLPAGMSPGAYFIAAVADRADRIPEADEQNNVAVSTGPFSVG